MKTISQLSGALESGKLTARRLIEQSLARIEDQAGEGVRVFLETFADQARTTADAMDRARARGAQPSALAGIPVSVKDLFDMAGGVTRAGSRVLADAPPARRDAVVVARLKAAGLIIMGRTNMTEFAYSGVGLNPHYGTPRNPYDRQTGRIPGGSSSGAAVSVTDGMAAAGMGTDTGGSCRIPAALCGIVGFKPTQRRVPLEGVYPLSRSLDSVGPLARSVDCCALIDGLISGGAPRPAAAFPLAGLRLAVPQSLVMEDMEDPVADAFHRALSTLSAGGAHVMDIPLAELLELPQINATGGLAAAEAFAWHRDMLDRAGALYDPRVGARIAKGAQLSAAEYISLGRARADFIDRVERRLAPFDALVLPTVPRCAPKMSELDDDRDYGRINMLMLRNPSVINFLDGCAISLPCHRAGEAPVGLMLAAPGGQDRRLLALAKAIEGQVSPPPGG